MFPVNSQRTGHYWVELLKQSTFNKVYYEYIASNLLKKKETPWPKSARELYRPRDCHLSAKLVPTFANRGCHVVSMTDPYARILDFLYPSRYVFF
jgi:hypothetical protein